MSTIRAFTRTPARSPLSDVLIVQFDNDGNVQIHAHQLLPLLEAAGYRTTDLTRWSPPHSEGHAPGHTDPACDSDVPGEDCGCPTVFCTFCSHRGPHGAEDHHHHLCGRHHHPGDPCPAQSDPVPTPPL